MKQLNNRQKTVILIGVAVVIAMIMFPPWQLTYEKTREYKRYQRTGWRTESDSGSSVEYGFLFSPPRAQRSSSNYLIKQKIKTSMAVGQLCMQLVGLGIVVAAAVVLLKQNRPPPQNIPPPVAPPPSSFS